MKMSDKTIVLVTGANTGLGFEIVRALCGSCKRYEMLLGGRSLAKAQKAADDVRGEFPDTASHISPVQIDIEDDDSIAALVGQVRSKFGRLDVLINNAGASFDPQLAAGKMTMRQVWNQSWSVNTTGTHVVTATFAPLLLQSNEPRLLFIASGTSSLALSENLGLPINKVPAKGWPKNQPPQASIPAYRSAKAGMNMLMREWHRNLLGDGVMVWGVSPGYLATGLGGSQEMNKKNGALDPSIGGQIVKEVVEGKRDDDAGKVITRDGVQPW